MNTHSTTPVWLNTNWNASLRTGAGLLLPAFITTVVLTETGLYTVSMFSLPPLEMLSVAGSIMFSILGKILIVARVWQPRRNGLIINNICVLGSVVFFILAALAPDSPNAEPMTIDTPVEIFMYWSIGLSFAFDFFAFALFTVALMLGDEKSK